MHVLTGCDYIMINMRDCENQCAEVKVACILTCMLVHADDLENISVCLDCPFPFIVQLSVGSMDAEC